MIRLISLFFLSGWLIVSFELSPVWALADCLPALPGEKLLDGQTTQGWRVECDGGSFHDEKQLACRGKSSGEISSADSWEGKGVKLEWNLGTGRWIYARYVFDKAIDLSKAKSFHVRLRGVGLGATYKIGVMFADIDNVFYGEDILRKGMDRWVVKRSMNRDEMTFQFFYGSTGSEHIDWKKIDRFFIVVKEPCVGSDCFGGGQGSLIFDEIRVSQIPGNPHEDLLVGWGDAVSDDRNSLSVPVGCGSHVGGTPILPSDSLRHWSAQCDRKSTQESQFPLKCNGNSRGEIRTTLNFGEPRVELHWDLKDGTWAYGRYAFPTPTDLSQARDFGLSLYGVDLARPAQVVFYFADRNDVFYGTEVNPEDFGLDDGRPWLLHVNIPKTSVKLKFNYTSHQHDIDWTKINRFFFGVRQFGHRTGPLAGNLQLVGFEQYVPVVAQEEFFNYCIGFSKNNAVVPGMKRIVIKDIADSLNMRPMYRAIIEPPIDPTEIRPEKIANQRGEALRKILIEEHGVPSDRLEVNVSKFKKGQQSCVKIFFKK